MTVPSADRAAVAEVLRRVRIVHLARMRPRRLAFVRARDGQLSLADEAVREAVTRLVSSRLRARKEPAKTVRSRRSGR